MNPLWRAGSGWWFALIISAVIAIMPNARAYGADTITDVGTFAGGLWSLPGGINDAGLIVGGAPTAGSSAVRAFLWDEPAGMQQLPTFSGEAFANAINADGRVVGRAAVSRFINHAFLWQGGGSLQDLGTLPGGSISAAYGINGLGQVVGESNTGSFAFHGFLWDAVGGMRDLGTLPGGTYSLAWGINDAGWVVGEAAAADGQPRAFLWVPDPGGGSMTPLGTLAGGTFSIARGINSAGKVVGGGDVADGAVHAFVWDATDGMQDLGTLPGGTWSFAYGINDAGQIVGGSTVADGSVHAFVWDGSMRDLGALPGSDYSVAYGVNASGQAVGHSTNADGDDRAVRWRLNRVPVATGQSLTTPQDTAVAFTLGGSDPDGDPVTFTVLSGPANGSVSGSPAAMTYTPAAGYSGADSITFVANDGTASSAPAIITITVQASDPPPGPSGSLPGRMIGQGHLDAGGARHYFEFRVAADDGPGDGALRYHARPGGTPRLRNVNFVSTAITAVAFSNDPALTPGEQPEPSQDTVLFAGTGAWNGAAGYTFAVTATDAGEPGVGHDRFVLTVTSPAGEVVAAVDGLLSGGNIQSKRVTLAAGQ
jgi:probable HAF family extracellular repeat protein